MRKTATITTGGIRFLIKDSVTGCVYPVYVNRKDPEGTWYWSESLTEHEQDLLNDYALKCVIELKGE